MMMISHFAFQNKAFWTFAKWSHNLQSSIPIETIGGTFRKGIVVFKKTVEHADKTLPLFNECPHKNSDLSLK